MPEVYGEYIIIIRKKDILRDIRQAHINSPGYFPYTYRAYNCQRLLQCFCNRVSGREVGKEAAFSL